MLESLMRHITPLSRLADRFEHSHPGISLVIFQVAVGIFLTAAVSGIALLGGAVIWAFYRIIGVL